jgi:hypothetical protein
MAVRVTEDLGVRAGRQDQLVDVARRKGTDSASVMTVTRIDERDDHAGVDDD